MSDYTKVTLDIDKDRYTGGIQIAIGIEDDDGCGHGYRLAGPKYLGASDRIKRVVLDRRDADEIRRYLDTIFPSVASVPAGREEPE